MSQAAGTLLSRARTGLSTAAGSPPTSLSPVWCQRLSTLFRTVAEYSMECVAWLIALLPHYTLVAMALLAPLLSGCGGSIFKSDEGSGEKSCCRRKKRAPPERSAHQRSQSPESTQPRTEEQSLPADSRLLTLHTVDASFQQPPAFHLPRNAIPGLRPDEVDPVASSMHTEVQSTQHTVEGNKKTTSAEKNSAEDQKGKRVSLSREELEKKKKKKSGSKSAETDRKERETSVPSVTPRTKKSEETSVSHVSKNNIESILMSMSTKSKKNIESILMRSDARAVDCSKKESKKNDYDVLGDDIDLDELESKSNHSRETSKSAKAPSDEIAFTTTKTQEIHK